MANLSLKLEQKTKLMQVQRLTIQPVSYTHLTLPTNSLV